MSNFKEKNKNMPQKVIPRSQKKGKQVQEKLTKTVSETINRLYREQNKMTNVFDKAVNNLAEMEASKVQSLNDYNLLLQNKQKQQLEHYQESRQKLISKLEKTNTSKLQDRNKFIQLTKFDQLAQKRHERLQKMLQQKYNSKKLALSKQIVSQKLKIGLLSKQLLLLSKLILFWHSNKGKRIIANNINTIKSTVPNFLNLRINQNMYDPNSFNTQNNNTQNNNTQNNNTQNNNKSNKTDKTDKTDRIPLINYKLLPLNNL